MRFQGAVGAVAQSIPCNQSSVSGKLLRAPDGLQKAGLDYRKPFHI